MSTIVKENITKKEEINKKWTPLREGNIFNEFMSSLEAMASKSCFIFATSSLFRD